MCGITWWLYFRTSAVHHCVELRLQAGDNVFTEDLLQALSRAPGKYVQGNDGWMDDGWMDGWWVNK